MIYKERDAEAQSSGNYFLWHGGDVCKELLPRRDTQAYLCIYISFFLYRDDATFSSKILLEIAASSILLLIRKVTLMHLKNLFYIIFII